MFLVEFHRAHPGITRRALGPASYDRLAALVRDRSPVLDLGCDGEPIGHYGIDLASGPIRARAEQLPFADGAFGAVVSHLSFMLFDAEAVAREIDRVLAPGGMFAAVLGGGPTADGDDAFHRFLRVRGDAAPRLRVDRRATSEAGWRALFPSYAIAFERLVIDRSGTFDEVFDRLAFHYEHDEAYRAPLRALCPEPIVPLQIVVWIATAQVKAPR